MRQQDVRTFMLCYMRTHYKNPQCPKCTWSKYCAKIHELAETEIPDGQSQTCVFSCLAEHLNNKCLVCEHVEVCAEFAENILRMVGSLEEEKLESKLDSTEQHFEEINLDMPEEVLTAEERMSETELTQLSPEWRRLRINDCHLQESLDEQECSHTDYQFQFVTVPEEGE